MKDNIALACFGCNRSKGPNISSIDPVTHQLVPLFNPRSQIWEEHFNWEGAYLGPLSPEARVTIRILDINKDSRIHDREQLMRLGLWSSFNAGALKTDTTD